MKLYNSLSKKKEEFKPIKKGIVGMYTCGPTVYNYSHIGNLRAYIFADILKKTLLASNFKVKQVMNITDVGHLTSDSDEGEDKMLAASKREKKDAWQIAKFYEKEFKSDMKKLNITFPDKFCRATDHIKEQVALVSKLEKKGFTYKINDGIYFDTSKFKDYGKMSTMDLKNINEGHRIGKIEGKKSKTDFALWKFSQEKNRDMEWDSPWGKGFPGWHLECSAMSMKYLGESFDIHTGGVDHLNIHHPNEIAQSEAATGKKFVNFWLHNEFLILKEGRMGKSKGNFITINNLETEGYSPLHYRLLMLQTNYRKQLLYSKEGIKGSKDSYIKIKELIKKLGKKKGIVNKSYYKKFLSSLQDDLNTPVALSYLFALVKDERLSNPEKLATIAKMDEVLSLGLLASEKVPVEVTKLAKEREKARKTKDFKNSDKLRNKIKALGYEVNDTKSGFELRKI